MNHLSLVACFSFGSPRAGVRAIDDVNLSDQAHLWLVTSANLSTRLVMCSCCGAGDETQGQHWSAVGRGRVTVHGVRLKTTQEAPLIQISICQALIVSQWHLLLEQRSVVWLRRYGASATGALAIGVAPTVWEWNYLILVWNRFLPRLHGLF